MAARGRSMRILYRGDRFMSQATTSAKSEEADPVASLVEEYGAELEAIADSEARSAGLASAILAADEESDEQ